MYKQLGVIPLIPIAIVAGTVVIITGLFAAWGISGNAKNLLLTLQGKSTEQVRAELTRAFLAGKINKEEYNEVLNKLAVAEKTYKQENTFDKMMDMMKLLAIASLFGVASYTLSPMLSKIGKKQ